MDNIFFTGRTIFNTSESGDRIVNILAGKSRKRLIENLKGYPTVKVILFSGGGNDFIGNLLNMLKPDCSGETTASACFQTAEFDAQFARIKQAYVELIALRDQHRPNVPIVTHQYDYATPSNKGVLWFNSWVNPSLDFAKVPVALRLDLVHILIDRFSATLASLQDAQFIVIPTAGTLQDASDWENEIHPSHSGIKKLTAKFEPVLRKFVV